MLFAAFAMILVGLLCFIYVSMGTDRKPDYRNSGYQVHLPTPRPSDWEREEQILRERAFASRKDRPSIVASSEVLEERNQTLKPIPEPETSSLQLQGILYLDYGGKLPFGRGEMKDTILLPEDVRSLRRVGEAKLQDRGGSLEFHSGHAQFSFPSRDLDQVVLFREGVVLIPRDPSLPKPLFLTREVDEIKEFLSQAKTI